jgi:hypothetical protein
MTQVGDWVVVSQKSSRVAKIFEIGTTEKNKPGICFRGFPRDEKTRRLAPAGQEFAP